jgi:hypothetical protein
MKYLLPLFLLASACRAALIPIAWDPASGATSYELSLSWGTNTVKAVTAGTAYTFSNLVNGVTYVINGTSISAQGVRSDPSTNFVVAVPGAPIIRLNFSLKSAPTPTGPWTSRTNIIMDVEANQESQFWLSSGIAQIH